MNIQNAKELTIEEGSVRTITDSHGNQLWGKVNYSVKYGGDTTQQTTPNPDYPQTVNTVTGRQVVTISDGDSQSQTYEVNLGKNLLDPSILIQGHINGGTPTNRVCTRSGDDIYVSGGDTYTISVSNIAIQVNVYGYKSINGTAIYESGWQTMPFTFELPSQANYLRLMFRYSNDSDIVPSDITCQLEKGSTATTYAPYISHFGKNMFDKNNVQEGYYISDTGQIVASSNVFISEYIPVLPNTDYVFSGKTGWYTDAYYDQEKNFIQRINGSAGDFYKVTTPANARYLRLIGDISAENVIQLEQGSTATPYQQFIGGQLELCKIGDYQDYIYKSSGNWYIHKATGVIDLTNITGWWLSGTHAIKNSLTNLGLSNIAYPSQNVATVSLCNYFEAKPALSLYNGVYPVGFGIASDGFYFSNNDWSLSDFNTFKTNNRIMVYYPLATATDIQITDATLIAQLEAINEWCTRYGYTFTVEGNVHILINQTNI